MNWAEFFDMGGYAFFVWTSYGLTLIVIVANIVAPVLQRKKVISRIQRAIKREKIETAQAVSNQAMSNQAAANGEKIKES